MSRIEVIGNAMLHLGDCLEVMRGMPDNSIDSIVTDPPYGLSDHKPAEVIACLTAWIACDPYLPKGKGFMGKTWDAWVPGPEVFRECLRVLKPGGHMLAFAGTRSMDLMSMAIRLAGFELRDSIGYAHDDDGGAPLLAWCYGSGFPKSLSVSKAIDKAGGVSPVQQAAMLRSRREDAGLTRDQVAVAVGCTASSVRDWEDGRSRAVGAPIEFIVPSEEYRGKLADLLGYSADERKLIGAADDRRNDGTVYGIGHSGDIRSGGHTDSARQWEGWGTALKPAWEPILLARRPLEGTVVANVLAHGTGALNIDGCLVHASAEDVTIQRARSGGIMGAEIENEVYGKGWARQPAGNDAGRWPANVIHDGSDAVLAGFPQADSARANGNPNNPKRGTNHEATSYGQGDGKLTHDYRDTGSAARFFYCAKASRADRNEGLEDPGPQFKTGSTLRDAENLNADDTRKGNTHPTVKPVDLMRYLCRLVTPPGGTVLDPFTGSGSTGKAAMREGFGFVGIEREAESFDIACRRIEDAQRQARMFA